LGLHLHLHPFRKRAFSLLRLTYVHERVCRNEPKLGRAPRTSRRIRTSARRRELSDDVPCELSTACQREPQRYKLMEVDAPMLARAVRIGKQPVHATAPLDAVEVHLTGETLDPVAAARLVASS
jgi:hypothetical protein